MNYVFQWEGRDQVKMFNLLKLRSEHSAWNPGRSFLANQFFLSLRHLLKSVVSSFRNDSVYYLFIYWFFFIVVYLTKFDKLFAINLLLVFISALKGTFMASIMICWDYLNMEDFHQRVTIYSLVITSTEGNNLWKPSVYF